MSLSNGALVLDKDHKYWKNDLRIPGISEVLKSAGLIDDRWFTEHSREKGSGAHAACHFFDEDDLVESSLDPVIIPHVEAWKKFRSETGFKPTIIEKKLYSAVFNFAGTPDRAGILNGDEVGVEIKTGAISFVTGLQLAAQEILLAEVEGFRVKKRFAVQTKNNGTYKLTQFSDVMDRGYFLSALNMWHLRYKNNLLEGEK
jgi:hypothetical protein